MATAQTTALCVSVLDYYCRELFVGALSVSTGSLLFYFVISPLYYVLSSHKGGDSPDPK